MKQPDKRIITAAISLLVTFSLLLGGYSFYNNYIVKKPLLQALKDVDGVQDVKVSKEEGQYRITVVLDEVENLQSSYVKLDETSTTYLARKGYELQIADHRSQQLTDLYDQMQPYIYEALAKNNYIWLQEEISRQLLHNSPDTEYRFSIDGDRIYLQLTQEQKSLYAVIPRQITEGTVSI
ncbi:MAG TPA: hypothetical protein P5273_01760 [Syntrophomonadaceae bacterium]|nr:hypothetical protein [Syntrophomonadaceae bacterium]